MQTRVIAHKPSRKQGKYYAVCIKEVLYLLTWPPAGKAPLSFLLHFNKLSYRCADGALGMPRHSCSRPAADTSRAASARSVGIGSIMRAPSFATDRHRNRPSPEPTVRWATEHKCFCGMLAAATTDLRRTALVRVPLPAVSDPKARSALRI